ncbi:hypothetical protein DFH08DRAFT_1082933 [Mycena albidolilacea]|uniref:F-box domain-containing protein n=1 Tax=Mycena albidolilacea TaxID=1033008 RepID=A0AAD6ZSK2_9AGAR|nr:hypothetical protein DFH08DRAFT_1082933 [Mycena albidolilacea]
MVLTRRAAKASKSIIRWLPNEILGTVMVDASRLDLVALCKTSRLMRNIATPLLYRAVFLATIPQINLFLRTMKQRPNSSPSLCRYVRRFSIAYYAEEHDSKPSPALLKAIHAVLIQFCHLEFLDFLLTNIEFTDMLRHAYFPNLAKFLYTVQHETAALLPAFLNRHATITHLTLTRDGPLGHLNPILLPNLTEYNGPSSLVSSFSVDSRPITSALLIWYRDDLDIATPLVQLGRIASPPTINGISTCEDLKAATILAGVATHLPHVKTFRCGRSHTAARISQEDTLEIATHLKKLASLSTMVLLGADDHSAPTLIDDRETVVLWGKACESLRSIVLHGREWKLTAGIWLEFDI